MKLLRIVLLLFIALSVQAQNVTFWTGNLGHGQGTDNAFDFGGQIAAFTGTPHLIAVQERTTSETGWDSAMASAGLAEAVYLENSTSQGDGPAIWYNTSTVTINTTYSHALSSGFIGWNGSTNVDKAAVAVKATVATRQFYFVSTHLCWSACADFSGSTKSAQRVAQATELVSWINSTLTGGLPIIVTGDMNFGPDYPKDPSGLQLDIFTADGYSDLWTLGISQSKATASWGDRDGDTVTDMPVGDLTTRTHDTRRIDYFFLKGSGFTLFSIAVPDSRATCSVALTLTGTYKECPDVVQLWDIPDDQGTRVSDHNFVKLVLELTPAVPSKTLSGGAKFSGGIVIR